MLMPLWQVKKLSEAGISYYYIIMLFIDIPAFTDTKFSFMLASVLQKVLSV